MKFIHEEAGLSQDQGLRGAGRLVAGVGGGRAESLYATPGKAHPAQQNVTSASSTLRAPARHCSRAFGVMSYEQPAFDGRPYF